MLHKLLYQSSDFEIIATVLVFFLSTGVFIYWIAFYPKFTQTLNKLVGVNQTLYGPVTTLFTFTAAFLGASVWGHFQTAQTAVGSERTALLGYYLVVDTNAHLKSSGLQQALEDYISAALNDEWKTLSSGASSSKTNELFSRLNRMSMEVAQQPEMNPLVAGALVRAIESVRTARVHRLGLRYQGVESTRWYAIMFLGILAQLTIMLTHLENRKRAPMATALLIVSSLVFSITTLIALSVNPYDGVIQVSKVPLQGVIDRIHLRE